MALTTVLSVTHVGHEDTNTTVWTLPSQLGNLSVTVDLVVVQDSQLDVLVLVLNLLWGGVSFLLLLLTTSQSQDQVKSRLLLDVVVRQSSAILQLLTSKDQSLLIWWDSLLVLDLLLDIVNGVGRLHLQGDSLTGQSLNENLHFDKISGLWACLQYIKKNIQCFFLTFELTERDVTKRCGRTAYKVPATDSHPDLNFFFSTFFQVRSTVKKKLALAADTEKALEGLLP